MFVFAFFMVLLTLVLLVSGMFQAPVRLGRVSCALALCILVGLPMGLYGLYYRDFATECHP